MFLLICHISEGDTHQPVEASDRHHVLSLQGELHFSFELTMTRSEWRTWTKTLHSNILNKTLLLIDYINTRLCLITVLVIQQE